MPPPSAAAGDIDIFVPEEPEADEDDEPEGYEAVGGDDAAEERAAPRRPKARRYKIQEVVKVRQILLVQVVKEERGNKGAALTTYLVARRALLRADAEHRARRRDQPQDHQRHRPQEAEGDLLLDHRAGRRRAHHPHRGGEPDEDRDQARLRVPARQWEQIRDLTLKSIAPAPIYEEGSLIKRVIRDLYSRDMDEILVDGERGYREAKDYMKMLMPSHAKNVKHYADPLPLFSRFQVESYLSAMFNPVVQLKSGGYIVIDVTEALVAIDVNSGRATREASIEETALKTNMEAAEEAARQMRLRDLAGLVVIDFIDMEDRRNNAAVEKKLKDKLKTDRARIQVGRISPFGLLEMSRQRLRPGMIEATTKACPHCHGTGRVRSDDSMALALLREVEEEGVKARSKEVLIVAPVEIANYLLNQKREHVAMIEARFGLSVRVEGDPSLISPDYRLERFKTASRIIPAPENLNLPTVAYPEEEIEEEEEAPEEEDEAAAEAAGERPPASASGVAAAAAARAARRPRRDAAEAEPAAAEAAPAGTPEAQPVAAEAAEPQPKSRRRSRGGRGAAAPQEEAAGPEAAAASGGGRDHRSRRGGAGVGDRRGARGGRPAAPPARAGAQAGDGGPGRGHLRRGGGDHAGAARGRGRGGGGGDAAGRARRGRGAGADRGRPEAARLVVAGAELVSPGGARASRAPQLRHSASGIPCSARSAVRSECSMRASATAASAGLAW